MEPDAHRSFNFNKLRSFLISRDAALACLIGPRGIRKVSGPGVPNQQKTEAVTGGELDSDQFVGPGVDYLPIA